MRIPWSEFLIIGDVAGQYDALMRLLCGTGELADLPLLFVGDIIDRGPKSAEVVALVRYMEADGDAVCLLGNHEQMMLEGQKFEGRVMWANNGGGATLESFGGSIPDDVREWVRGLPLIAENDDLVVSHAPLKRGIPEGDEDQYAKMSPYFAVWNRDEPTRRKRYQVHGHQWFGGTYADGDGAWGSCIDYSSDRKLTAMHWPSRTLYHEDYDGKSTV